MLGMFGLSPSEMMIVGVVAVLLFGSRLPSVARSMGKSFIEFKKGMRGIEDDLNLNDAVYDERPAVKRYDEEDRQLTSAPRFEPPKQAESPGSSEPSSTM
jgi:sec-independent protein translocase protein TatA